MCEVNRSKTALRNRAGQFSAHAHAIGALCTTAFGERMESF
jgi:hypothetical protein